jgi:hypothetical protein
MIRKIRIITVMNDKRNNNDRSQQVTARRKDARICTVWPTTLTTLLKTLATQESKFSVPGASRNKSTPTTPARRFCGTAAYDVNKTQ